MACFLVPAAEAIVTSVAKHFVKKAEAKSAPETYTVCNEHGEVQRVEKIRFSEKLEWLNKMLIGGSALLLFEHAWHGELVPTSESLAEMSTAGVAMAVSVTLVWICMLAACFFIEKRAVKAGEYKKTVI